jgi:hypothetical protein
VTKADLHLTGPLILAAQAAGTSATPPLRLRIFAPLAVDEDTWCCGFEVDGLDVRQRAHGISPYQAFNLACILPWQLVQPSALHFDTWQTFPGTDPFGDYLRELVLLAEQRLPPARTMAVMGGTVPVFTAIVTAPVRMTSCNEWTLFLDAPAHQAPRQAFTAPDIELCLTLALQHVQYLSGRPWSGDLPDGD